VLLLRKVLSKENVGVMAGVFPMVCWGERNIQQHGVRVEKIKNLIALGVV
jgi:hypothetical protein